jgi:hypothetical protein
MWFIAFFFFYFVQFILKLSLFIQHHTIPIFLLKERKRKKTKQSIQRGESKESKSLLEKKKMNYEKKGCRERYKIHQVWKLYCPVQWWWWVCGALKDGQSVG